MPAHAGSPSLALLLQGIPGTVEDGVTVTGVLIPPDAPSILVKHGGCYGLQ